MAPGSIVAIALFTFSSAHGLGESVVGFDSATASSTYAARAFTADKAATVGAGYWCSSGGHLPSQAVVWTGALSVRHRAVGVKLHWAYAPGEFKVLTSAGGGNFEEAACWRAPSQSEASFTESVMFDSPRSVQALTVSMRDPRPWQYFGLNAVSLIVEPYAFMLVSGVAAPTGEVCVMAQGSHVLAGPCLDAIAAGDGREVFFFSPEQQLVSSATQQCVVLRSPDPAFAGELGLQPCRPALDAADGRSAWELSGTGQLQMKHMSNYCMDLVSGKAVARECEAVGQSSDGGGGFSLVAASESNPQASASAKSGAALLNAAVERQRGLLGELHEQLPALADCKLVASLSGNSSIAERFSLKGARGERARVSAKAAAGDDAMSAIERIYPELGVDMVGLRALMEDSAAALKSAQSKMVRSA